VIDPIQILKQATVLPCTSQQREDCTAAIKDLYYALGSTLPDDHAWKADKIQHSEVSQQIAQEITQFLGFSESLQNITAIASVAHDIGRIPQGLAKVRGEVIDSQEHGRLGIPYLEEVFSVYLGESKTWVIEAIIFHSYKDTPKREVFSSALSWAFCCLIRDIDKSANFAEAKEYTNNTVRKIKEAKAAALLWTEVNPTAETHSIDTNTSKHDVLDEFLEGRLIIRQDCASYEAYMLQLLAWLYDFNVSEIRAIVIATGGPATILMYLQQQLGEHNKQYQKIAQQVKVQWGIVV
jgi:hypothetical protein